MKQPRPVLQCLDPPRLVIAGLSGGSGKTLLSLGLTRAFVRQGLVVQPCKKGPDYIDAAWLALAAGRPSTNLDPYFLTPEQLQAQFLHACQTFGACQTLERGHTHPACPANLAIIEGNRGLYDGRDVSGSCSTAQLALTLNAPVVLALNCAKMTRTAAALVAGVASFEPGLNLAGVVINNAGSSRHASQVRQAIEHYTDVPVLGAMPRLPRNPLPERHMGLSLNRADPELNAILDRLADYAAEHTELETLLALARSAPDLENAPTLQVEPQNAEEQAGSSVLLTEQLMTPLFVSQSDRQPPHATTEPKTSARPRIGYVRDDALWFYYEENLEALRDAGADLVELGLLDPAPWPALDGLYLGGGFPELFAPELAASAHLADIRALSEANRPIYAECGGFMVLCQALALPEGSQNMAGVLPVSTRFFSRPQGLGYVEATTLLPNPFHPVGSVWRGHEFHYSRCETTDGPVPAFILRLTPGVGMGKTPDGHGLDGLCVRNTFASYTHLFAPAVPHWAINFVASARRKTCESEQDLQTAPTFQG